MVLTRQTLERLTERHEEPCVSMYFPAVRKDDTAQNSIRFKNLAKKARSLLVDDGLKPREADELLAPAADLLKDELFWDRLENGVAAFLAPGFFEIYKLPFAVDEAVHVNARFYVKPLFRLVASNTRYFVLSISRSRTRLFEGTEHQIREVAAPTLPQGLDEELPDDRAEQQHTRSFSVERRGAAGAVHGREVDKVDKTDIARHFTRVDAALNEILRDSTAPLLLAGVEYELPIYRQANTYPFLEPDAITGNVDDTPGEELRERAWALVAPRFGREVERALETYQDRGAADKTSADLRTILNASLDGRVHALFLDEKTAHWGLFEPKTRETLAHTQREPGDEDLADLAGLQTLSTGGQVFVLPAYRMPGGASIAAVLRY